MKIIVGSGIAALWCANHLQSLGHDVVVLEKQEIGCGQTIFSQGMIHGGAKYSLDGQLSKSTISISDMPHIWRNALDGIGYVDLSNSVKITDFQFLWSSANAASKLLSFFGSKVMSSKMKSITPSDHDLFSSDKFKGSLFKLNEPVVDVQTVLENLANNLDNSILNLEVKKIEFRSDNSVDVVTNKDVINCDEVVLAAGEGNEKILQNSNINLFPMQLRPLAMGAVYLNNKIPDIFGHHLGVSSRPSLTISTHYVNGDQVLYVGGDISESGVFLSDSEQKIKIKDSIKSALYWLDFDIKDIKILRINRAEARNHNLIKPDTFFCEKYKKAIICWPTKLAFAPLLSESVITKITKDRIKKTNLFSSYTAAKISRYPWEIS